MQDRADIKTPKKHGCWLWGCASISLVALLVVASCFVMVKQGEASVAPIADQYLELVAAGNFEEAYDRIGNKWTESQSFEEFSTFHRMINSKLGDYQSRKITGTNITRGTSASSARLVYSAVFQNGTCEITITLEKIESEWKVQGARFNSNILKALFECPACGTVHKVRMADEDYCSNCGAAFAEIEAANE